MVVRWFYRWQLSVVPAGAMNTLSGTGNGCGVAGRST